MSEQIGFKKGDPPPPARRGATTKYAAAIDEAHANPTAWIELAGEHSAGNVETLRRHGVKCKTQKTGPHKVKIWITVNGT